MPYFSAAEASEAEALAQAGTSASDRRHLVAAHMAISGQGEQHMVSNMLSLLSARKTARMAEAHLKKLDASTPELETYLHAIRRDQDLSVRLLMGDGYQGDDEVEAALRDISKMLEAPSAARVAEVQQIAEGGNDPEVLYLAPFERSDRRDIRWKQSDGIR